MNVLMIGPFPSPLTGESLANNELFNRLQERIGFRLSRINTSLDDISSEQGSFSLLKLFQFSLTYLQSYKVLRSELVYITPGQSFLGLMKYLPFVLTSKLFRKKVIFHIHGGKLRHTFKESKGLRRTLLFFIFRFVDSGIVLSKSLRSNFAQLLTPESIYEVANFSTDDIYQIAFEDKVFDRVRVLYLSNLMVEKGVLDVIDSFEILKTESSVSFVLAGNIESSNRALILQRIEESGIQYVGPKYGDAKVQLLKECNLLLLPTYYKTEGQPISIIEGMVSGNYILTTCHSGIPDIVSLKNGSFVKKQNADQLSKSILDLSNDLTKLRETALFNYIDSRPKYSIKKFESAILKVFYNVINN